MKRLVSKQQPKQPKQPKDDWLGNAVEITNPDSKFFGFFGVVDKLKNDKYTVKVDPAPYENTDKQHLVFVPVDKVYKWLRLLPKEQ